MFFQLIMKGLQFDDDAVASSMLCKDGIGSNWFRKHDPVSHAQWNSASRSASSFGTFHDTATQTRTKAMNPSENTRPLSRTARTVESKPNRNEIHLPFLTALQFATAKLPASGLHLLWPSVHARQTVDPADLIRRRSARAEYLYDVLALSA